MRMPYQPRIVNLNGYTTYHDEVRAHLGVDSGVLPDSDIDAPSVLPIAEGLVVSRVPDYDTLTDDNQSFMYAAAVAMIAAVLAPSMASRLKASEGDSDYKYTNQNVDWTERKKDLEAVSYGHMDLITTQTVVELPQLGLSGPTRSKAQQLAAQGESGFISPDSGDIALYPTNQE
ncbi:hypothetical protein [Alicyclobacillus dauci]|uniref:Uncharacterized protein n=1 Tax=Alicyclobacillus dauci TaxID=1475485 RepID=A0ABY6YWX1_9BACL|nr:hypothetical protein [Alicyclobacillus dauci]WAH35044.1 hypothetical protein NZD86_11965 [Alicyclobacillus dauci]